MGRPLRGSYRFSSVNKFCSPCSCYLGICEFSSVQVLRSNLDENHALGLHFVSCWLSLRTRGNLAEKLASMARSPLRVGNASYLDHCSGRRINISRFNRHSLKTALSETTASRIAPRDECRKPIGLLEAQEICTDCQLSLRQRY